jgi:hypothetical protein
MQPFYSSKAFVNQAGCNSDASIFTEIKFYSEESSRYDATLKMKDCGNSIHYTVGLNQSGDRSYDNTIFKLDTLIAELTAFKEALVRAKVVHDEREAKEEAERQKQIKNYEIHSGIHNHPLINGADNPIPSSYGRLDPI